MLTFGRKIEIDGSYYRTQVHRPAGELLQDRYEQQVMALLERLYRTSTGFALLLDITLDTGPDIVRIIPSKMGILGGGPCRATESARPFQQPGSQVEFSPDNFVNRRCDAGVGSEPDEVLFHELVHAGHTLRGTLNAIAKMPVRSSLMSNFAEFCAMTAANVLRSELRRAGLRSGHAGFYPALTLTKSKEYYDFFMQEIDFWFFRQPAFCGHLATVQATFNPLRAKLEYDKAIQHPGWQIP
jgi:hypothetical protein